MENELIMSCIKINLYVVYNIYKSTTISADYNF